MASEEVRYCDCCGQELPPVAVEDHPILGPPWPFIHDLGPWRALLESFDTPLLRLFHEGGPLGSDPS